MESLNVGSVNIGSHDADWFRVMAAVSHQSVRGKAGSVIGYFVRRRKAEYREIIQYVANKHGLSFDECFNRLRNGEDLGEPLDYFEIDKGIEGKVHASEE